MSDFPGGSDSKISACNAGDLGLEPRKIPWKREWQPTPVFSPGESHGQRSLVGYNPWGHKELISYTQYTQITEYGNVNACGSCQPVHTL